MLLLQKTRARRHNTLQPLPSIPSSGNEGSSRWQQRSWECGSYSTASSLCQMQSTFEIKKSTRITDRHHPSTSTLEIKTSSKATGYRVVITVAVASPPFAFLAFAWGKNLVEKMRNQHFR